MTRLAWGVVFATAVVVGCQPAKELPEFVVKGTEPGEQTSPVPAKSDPAAKAFVEKAVKVYTGGKPELLEKGNASRLARKGKQLPPLLNQRTMVEATQNVAAVWPDRYHGVNDLAGQGRIEVWLHRPRLTVKFGGREDRSFNAVAYEKILAADFVGQHWMTLFLPLTDPKAIVYDLRSQMGVSHTGQPLRIQLLKLSLGEHPVYELTFDDATSALLRVEYTIEEQGRDIRRRWTMIEHKVGAEGLLLPTKMELRWDNDIKEVWEETKWEFPAAIKDDEFQPPAN